MQVMELEDAEALLIAARWPKEPTCPSCGRGARRLADKSLSGWSTWRCVGCRKRFTATTGTAIHSTKLPPSDWLAAAGLQDLTPSIVAEQIGVSLVTARKVAAAIQPAKDHPLPDRLRHLFGVGLRREPVADPWQIDPLPATLQAEDNPLVSLSNGTKAVLNALRARPFGATAAKLAELAELSYSQTSRCLADLERRGWAQKAKTTVQHGYDLRPVTVWTLSQSAECMKALAFLRDRPTRRNADTGDRVPQRFWRNFWSGASADTLRISQHGLHIAETLIGGRDVCARAWAISALPASVLQECRRLRGFGTGLTADLIDAELTRRAVVA